MQEKVWDVNARHPRPCKSTRSPMQAVAQFVHVPLRSRLCFHLRLLHLCGRRGREHDHRLGDERRGQQGLVLILAV